jgi:ribonuclease HII
MRLCGIDEAGRGPVIGPMVMAGVLIDDGDEDSLRRIGVKDSKLLLPEKREELFLKMQGIVHDYEVRIVPAEEIDAALSTPGMNLNWLEAAKTAEIINRLMPDKAIVDCPSTNTSKYRDYLSAKLLKKIPLVAEHKADAKYPVVAAASIIAKVIRDKEIEKLRELHGDFGNGYLSDEKTAKFMKEHHDKPIFRKSWKPWQEIAIQKRQRSLFDY